MRNKFFYWSLVLSACTALSCSKPEDPGKEEETPQIEDPKPEIVIPSESQAVFSSGIAFEATASTPLEAKVRFSTNVSWAAGVTDTKASSWLSVKPSSGGAGDVEMTVTAQPNQEEKERKAKVTITCGDQMRTFSVSQAPYVKPVVEVQSVTLDKTTLNLVEGQHYTLVATVLPQDAADKTVKWESSKPEVATVDGGEVTALAEGTAVITAKAGTQTASCKVTVQKDVVVAESVSLNKNSLALVKGQEEVLVATVWPENTTDQTVNWSSTDSNIASVDHQGRVSARNGGSATIKAVTTNNLVAECLVTVTVPVASVTLSHASLSLLEGRTAILSASVLPEDATDKSISWSSSIPSVANVSADGLVTAVSAGKVQISAKVGNVSAVCDVTVEAIQIGVSPIALELDPAKDVVSVKVKSNVAWTASAVGEWYSLSAVSGEAGETSVDVAVTENGTTNERKAQVTFSAEGRTAVLSIVQHGIDPDLSVAGPSEKLPASAGTYQLSVTSNIEWTLSVSEPWVKPDITSSAKGSVGVSISVDKNYSAQERSAVLSFAYGGKSFSHTLVQKGCEDISGFTGSIEDWEDESAEFIKK